MTISEWHVYHYNVIQLQCGSKRDILQSLYDPQKFFRAESLKLRSHVESHLWWTFHLTDSFYCNLCNPFKFDLRCALFSLLSLLKTKSKPQRGAVEVIFESITEITGQGKSTFTTSLVPKSVFHHSRFWW